NLRRPSSVMVAGGNAAAAPGRAFSERSDQTSVEGTRIPLVRRERFMTRRLLASLCIAAAAFVLTAQAQTVKIDPAKVRTTGTSEKDFNPERLAAEQQQLKMEFLEFKQQLLRLAQNLELSNKPENKEKAKMLREALEKAAQHGFDAKFNKLIETLKSPKVMSDLAKLTTAEQVNAELRRDLQTLLRILLSDNRAELLRAERLRTEKLLEQLKDVIR